MIEGVFIQRADSFGEYKITDGAGAQITTDGNFIWLSEALQRAHDMTGGDTSRIYVTAELQSELMVGRSAYVKITDLLHGGYKVEVVRGGKQEEFVQTVKTLQDARQIAEGWAQNVLGINPEDIHATHSAILISAGALDYDRLKNNLKQAKKSLGSAVSVQITQDEDADYRAERLKVGERIRKHNDLMNRLKVHFEGFATMMNGAMGMKQHIEDQSMHRLMKASEVDARISIEEERARQLEGVNRHMIEVVQYIAPQLIRAWEDLLNHQEGGAE